MKLVDLVLEVRFAATTQLIERDLRFELAKKITPGDEATKNEVEVPGIDILLKEKRLKVAAESNRYAISIQDKNEQRAHERMCDYVKLVNETISYSQLKVARIGIRSSWIHKSEGSFEDLAAAFGAHFYQANDLITGADDFAVNLTFNQGDFKIGYVAGPIRKNEPLPLVTFQVGDLNPANVLVSADYFRNECEPLSVGEICALIPTALSVGREKAQLTIGVLGV